MNLRILSPTTVRATCLLLLLVAVRGGRQEAQKPRYDSYSKAKELSCGAKFTAPMEGLTKDKTFPCKFTKSILGKWEKAGLKFGWYKMVKGSPTKNQIMRIYTKYNDYPTAAAFVLVLARPNGGSESSSCNWAVWQRSKHNQPLQFHGDGKSTIYIGVAGPGVDGDFVQGEVKCLTAAVNDNFEDAITSSCGSTINVPANAVATNDTLRYGGRGYSKVPTNNYPCDPAAISWLWYDKATDAISWLWYKFPEGKFATGAEVTFTGPDAARMVVLGVKSESNYRSKCVHAQREADSTGTLKFVAAPKTLYFLGLEAAKDAFSVSVECETKEAPPNDNYANAEEQDCGAGANTVTYETSGATVDTKFPCKWDKSILAEDKNINQQYVWVKLVPSNQQVVRVKPYYTGNEWWPYVNAVILAKPKGGSEKSKCSMALRVKWGFAYFQGDETTDVYIGMSPLYRVGTPISLQLQCPRASPNNNYKDAIPVSCGQQVPDVSGDSTPDFLPPNGYSLVPTNNFPCKVPGTWDRDWYRFVWYRLAVPKNRKVTIKEEERTDWTVLILGFKEDDEDDFDKKCALVNSDAKTSKTKTFKTKSGYKYLMGIVDGWAGQNIKISVTCKK